MTAVTETSAGITEFAGHRKVFFAKVNSVTTTCTLTVEEFVSIDCVIATLAEQAVAGCAGVCCASVASNVASLNLVKGDGSASSTTVPLDYYVMVIGKDE